MYVTTFISHFIKYKDFKTGFILVLSDRSWGWWVAGKVGAHRSKNLRLTKRQLSFTLYLYPFIPNVSKNLSTNRTGIMTFPRVFYTTKSGAYTKQRYVGPIHFPLYWLYTELDLVQCWGHSPCPPPPPHTHTHTRTHKHTLDSPLLS